MLVLIKKAENKEEEEAYLAAFVVNVLERVDAVGDAAETGAEADQSGNGT